MKHVLIMGAGALGRAMGSVISSDRARVSYWDIDASKCPDGLEPLPLLVRAADVILICVPSRATRSVLEAIAPTVQPSTILVPMAKGLEVHTAKTMVEICTEQLPRQRIASLGGAILAHDIARGLPAFAALGCVDEAVAAAIVALFDESQICIERYSDINAVAFGGVLKNIYALLLGISDGLQLGSNMHGRLAERALEEMLQIADALHFDRQVMLSVAGLGDLVATGMSPDSNNHMAGAELARTGRTEIVCEGIISLAPMMERVRTSGPFQLLEILNEIVVRGQPPRTVLNRLMC